MPTSVRASVRAGLMSAITVVTASALVATPIRPPAPELLASRAVQLSATITPLTSPSANVASLVSEIGMGIIPSLGAPFPAPPIPGPSAATTDFADAIKNTYSAIEPYVRYGFELAEYAVGFIPYVSWLSPQILILYNFGESIVRSLVFNSADWLWGPLPFGQGVQNIALDTRNALIQLGADEWNFFLPPLPPLPPLPFAAKQPTTAATPLATTPSTPLATARQQRPGSMLAQVLQALRKSFGLPETGGTAITVRNPITQGGQPSGTAVTEATTEPTGTDPATVPLEGASATASHPTDSAALGAVLSATKTADRKALRQSAPSATTSASATASAGRPGANLRPSREIAKTHNAVRDGARKKSTPH
jgi:hypothetical protein